LVTFTLVGNVYKINFYEQDIILYSIQRLHRKHNPTSRIINNNINILYFKYTVSFGKILTMGIQTRLILLTVYRKIKMWNPTILQHDLAAIHNKCVSTGWVVALPCDGGVVYDDVDTVTATDGLGSTNVGNYVGRRQFNLARGRPRKGVVGLKDT